MNYKVKGVNRIKKNNFFIFLIKIKKILDKIYGM